MRKPLVLAGLCLLALQGCATKNFGRVGELTEFERNTMSCREIDLELAKVAGFRQSYMKENEMDGRDLLAFFGDFGIGNQMALYTAEQSANGREEQLRSAALSRGCATSQPQALAAPSPAQPDSAQASSK